MPIKLSRPFASNSAVADFDVRQMKKVLNRLGYYQPFDKTGITGISEAEVFIALKEFQKDNNLPATGTAKPDGYYIWRIVEDGHARASHAKLNRTIRKWSDSPDPGDDYNCRCWAEPSPVQSDVFEAYKNVSKHLNSLKNERTMTAASLLEHYLTNDGKKITLPENAFDDSEQLLNAISNNQFYFENSFIGERIRPTDKNYKNSIISLKDKQIIKIKDHWDTDVKSNPLILITDYDSDFSYSIGSVKLRSTGDLKIMRYGDFIYIEGPVTHEFNDIYDFNPNGYWGTVFRNEILLAKKGYARPFTVHWERKEYFSAKIEIDGSSIKNSNFIWSDDNK